MSAQGPGDDVLVDDKLGPLRQAGADRLDPVRFHYIEALASRANAHQGSVKRILNGKLDAAVTALRQRIELVQRDAEAVPATAVAQPPQRETLGDLVRHMAQHTAHTSDNTAGALATMQRAELKSVRYFRNTWSKLSAEKQVTQALGKAPKNAGPINSHVVALRSLALMRDTSPDYLNRFMSYVDTLMCLEQGDRPPAPVSRKSSRKIGL
ncbi:MAG: DUF2894 domain-containing protein [Rhodoferax sp.]